MQKSIPASRSAEMVANDHRQFLNVTAAAF